jgi:hypothetical protein
MFPESQATVTPVGSARSALHERTSGILARDEVALTKDGARQLRRLGLDLPGLRAGRPPLTRACLD